MLVTCPKCGFNQPQDRYCAKCGVNMETFHKKEPSVGEKLINGPAPFILVLLIIAGLIALRVQRIQDRATLAESSSTTATNIVKTAPSVAPPSEIASTAQSPEQARAGSPSDSEAKPPELNPAGSAAQPEISEKSAEVKPLLVASAPSTEPPSQVAPNSTLAAKTRDAKRMSQVKVTYFENPSSLMTTVIEESQTSELFSRQGETVVGLISKTNSAWSQSREQFRVLKSESKKIEGANSLVFDFGELPDGEKALTLNFEIGEFVNQELKGNLEVRRTQMRGISAMTIPTVLELTRDSGVFISGALPRLQPPDFMGIQDRNLLQIFKSRQFQRAGSDFVIFIELSGE